MSRMSLKKRIAIIGSAYLAVGLIAAFSAFPLFLEFGPLCGGFIFSHFGVPKARKWAAAEAGAFTAALSAVITLTIVFVMGLATASGSSTESEAEVHGFTVWRPEFAIFVVSLSDVIGAVMGATGGFFAEALRRQDRQKEAAGAGPRSIDLRDYLKE